MPERTFIKMCGLRRPEDIAAANEVQPDYIGFVFFPGSKRCVLPETAAELRESLSPAVKAVGVFVDEAPETVAGLLNAGIIDIAQLHGSEDDGYIERLKNLTSHPVIKASKIRSKDDAVLAQHSKADHILLDAGAGDGLTFDWSYLKDIKRDYFLAGGLDVTNVAKAIKLDPYAVDVSSGIETDGKKDKEKMKAFAANVRNGRKTNV